MKMASNLPSMATRTISGPCLAPYDFVVDDPAEFAQAVLDAALDDLVGFGQGIGPGPLPSRSSSAASIRVTWIAGSRKLIHGIEKIGPRAGCRRRPEAAVRHRASSCAGRPAARADSAAAAPGLGI